MIPVGEAPGIIAAVVVMCALDVIVVGLRFYVRRRLRQRLGSDDWLLFAALVCFLVDRNELSTKSMNRF